MTRVLIKIASWALGFSLGTSVGAVLIALFVPISSDEVRQRLQAGYQGALQEARLAAQLERARLERELAEMQQNTPSLPESTPVTPIVTE